MDEYEFPTSPAQERLLVLDRLSPGSAQYHVPVAFAVRGPFDVAAFAAAVDALVERHEALRTAFRVEGGEYRQVVAAEASTVVSVVRGIAPSDVDEALRAEAARPFDLERGPLVRGTAYEVTDGSHRILLTAHHAICDGWSMQIMLRELAAGYRSVTVAPPALQFPDYAAWERSRPVASVAYWRDLLRGAPALLDLPADRPRPAVQSTAGAVERFVLPAGLRGRIAGAARDRGTTPFAVLFAAYAAFLCRITGRRDLVVGVPVAGRDHPEAQDTVGLLTNTLAVRVDLSGEPSFATLVDRLRDRLRESGPYQDAPFGAVVAALAAQRQLSHDPVVQVVFAYDDDAALELELPGARVERIDVPLGVAKFDFTLYVERWGADLVGQFHYRTALLDAATVRAWARAFLVLTGALLDRPEAPLTAADLLDDGERTRILRDWNPPGPPAPDRLVPDLIAGRARERPHATALVFGETVLTYRELMERADGIASALRSAGIGPDVPVGLCLPRSADMAVAALAVLRAGGAYVPLDPRQPPARLARMLADAGAALVLAGAGATPVPAGTVAPAAAGVPVAVLSGGVLEPVPPLRARAAGPLRPEHAAYLLFTSGSTGAPKGIAVPHGALTNMATAVGAHLGVTAADRVLQQVAFSFDVAVSDLLATWVAGAALHIADEHERLGEALHERLRGSRITWALLPPAAVMSMPHSPGALPDLRTLLVGGEACPAELVQRWSAPGRLLVNAYGPAENTVYATSTPLAAGGPVRIGRPVPNVRAYLLDERLRPVPVGVPGEIYLAGAGLARGYAHRPGLTAERFVADPFGPPGARMYRTGDLGRFDAVGSLSYLGRTDGQVQVRGFRVELGEIETVLAAHPRVEAAAATVRGARLVAYVVGAGAEPGELRAWLAERLPGYMLPEYLGRLERFPLGRTGKLDRSRLPDPPATRPELGRAFAPPSTDAERRVAGLWAGVLGLDRVGAHDNFFDLGGNSILLLAVLNGLREQGEAGLSMVDLFRHPTVAALAARLGGPATAGDPAGSRAAQRRGAGRRELLAARLLAAKGRASTGHASTGREGEAR